MKGLLLLLCALVASTPSLSEDLFLLRKGANETSYYEPHTVFIGLVFAGVGVFPLALWAAFIGVGQFGLGFLLIGMLVVTFGARMIAIAALSQRAGAEVIF